MKLLVICFCFFSLVACDNSKTKSEFLNIQFEEAVEQFDTVEWEALIPKDELETILNPPKYIEQVVDGSAEDKIGTTTQSTLNIDPDSEAIYQQALTSTNIIEAMDGQNIRIPGFIVPVTFIGEHKISSFFLVPYFGACLHMPPPPPNQIIFVKSDKGVTLESLSDPVWVSGKLSAEIFEDEIATSAYTMKMADIVLYDLEE